MKVERAEARDGEDLDGEDPERDDDEEIGPERLKLGAERRILELDRLKNRQGARQSELLDGGLDCPRRQRAVWSRGTAPGAGGSLWVLTPVAERFP